MSVENAKKFKKDIESNEELRKNFEEEMKKEGASGEKDYKVIVKIAQKLGYDITEEDFVNNKTEAITEISSGQELNEEELDKVAGGQFWCGPYAPDGYEVGCFLFSYENWWRYFQSDGFVCPNPNCNAKLGQKYKNRLVNIGSGDNPVIFCPECHCKVYARYGQEGIYYFKC